MAKEKQMSITGNDYNGSLTREQFLFHEMRITARLLESGKDDASVIAEITRDNLFQFPTERSVKNIAQCCLRRLHSLDDMELVQAIANMPSEFAKQICLYAMMRQNNMTFTNGHALSRIAVARFACKDKAKRVTIRTQCVRNWKEFFRRSAL